VIDEQHRFGVHQRQKLKNKGTQPHFLVMTATPIPRTLTMTVYGDLDVSLIEEMPPGRNPVKTKKFFQKERTKAITAVEAELKKGQQAYFVFPLVAESESLDLKSAEFEFEELKKTFKDYSVGLLHGKMKPAEKDLIMEAFRKNEIQVLVSTTVIEVGVDVPNATVMVIENCERFGLSQLHQLRGRVGRGEHNGQCYLILGNKFSKESLHRAQVMEQTTNGFTISEEDLKLRGPGEVLGKRQSGLPAFKLADLLLHQKVLIEARKAAFEWVANPKSREHIKEIKKLFAHKLELVNIS
jgi:ATP-dependent DNA helicase RecG